MAHVFYGLQDQEQLDHSIDEVMERHFDGIPFDQLPAVVKVYHSRHIQPHPSRVGRDILETLLEHLNEDYGDPENYFATMVYPEQQRAATHFVRTILDGYSLYQCKLTGDSEWVNVRDWAAEHQS